MLCFSIRADVPRYHLTLQTAHAACLSECSHSGIVTDAGRCRLHIIKTSGQCSGMYSKQQLRRASHHPAAFCACFLFLLLPFIAIDIPKSINSQCNCQEADHPAQDLCMPGTASPSLFAKVIRNQIIRIRCRSSKFIAALVLRMAVMSFHPYEGYFMRLHSFQQPFPEGNVLYGFVFASFPSPADPSVDPVKVKRIRKIL